MRSRSFAARNRNQLGVTLIEILITVVVISIGLLGVAALQIVSLKTSRTALQRSYATMYAYDIADCMRANRSAAVSGAYSFDFGASPSRGSIAGDDMDDWKTAITNNLPNGQGSVSVTTNLNKTSVQALIEVRWTEAIESSRTLTFATQTSL